MLRERQGERLDPWLAEAAGCEVAALQRFAAGLSDDYAAVRAGLTLPHSNGQLEGQVNRLKAIKRQMYGRASFVLLRQRVLHPCATSQCCLITVLPSVNASLSEGSSHSPRARKSPDGVA
jgi:Transposase